MKTHRRRPWQIVPASETTPEALWLSRRELLRAAAAAGAGAVLAGPFSLIARAEDPKSPYPSKRNGAFTLDRPTSPEHDVTHYNNFYELTTDKAAVAGLTGSFKPEPWKVEVTGLCARPRTFDLDDLRRIEHEERLYRHRCVETWAMAVPWIGFPMSRLLEKVEPTAAAKFVRFESVNRPAELPGLKSQAWYPWPYFEALTIDEAKNDLALFATGLYGKALPRQNGAPIRAVVPWKYGYKSSKSIVKIELVAERPETFWHKVAPDEYGFYSNVNPAVPHPRWSQAQEHLIGTDEKRPTLPFNGYGALVAGLYKGLTLNKPGD